LPARPSASFIVFSYNQERFIREAVEAAFAQTCEPLEIILSDDGSSDRTFEIMREMASAYRGPHQVRAIQTERNLGITRHALLRCREAAGDIIVVAAGDDISKPERTAKLVAAFGDDPAVMAVSSGFDLIDSEGALIAAGLVTPVAHANDAKVVSYLRGLKAEYRIIQGSSASYRREVFDLTTPPGEILFSEDNLLNFLIYANGGRVQVLPDSLVLYRQHAGALNNRGQERLSVRQREERNRSNLPKLIDKFEAFLWIAGHCREPGLVDTALLRRDLHAARVRQAWPQMGVAARMLRLALSIPGGARPFLKWQALRLFGRFPEYQPLNWTQARRRADRGS
jgi:glycosyltransferase involved in cell wall biosynthesis